MDTIIKKSQKTPFLKVGMNGVAFCEPKNLLWEKSPNRLRHVKNHWFLSTIRILFRNSEVYSGVGDFANFYDSQYPCSWF